MWLLDGSFDMHNGMGWWMIWSGVMMALFWGAVIALVAGGVTRVTGQHSINPDSASDIARRRYAGGEIGREEFEQIHQDLAWYEESP